MTDSKKEEFGLAVHILDKIRNTFKKYPQVKQVIIYGSRAKGNFKQGSDLDLTLKGKDLTLEILLKIENEIDDLLLPYKFDLSIYEKITDQDVIEHIDRIGKTFFIIK